VTGSGSVPALGPALQAEYPEVRNAARVQNGQAEHLLEHGDRAFREPVQMADAGISTRAGASPGSAALCDMGKMDGMTDRKWTEKPSIIPMRIAGQNPVGYQPTGRRHAPEAWAPSWPRRLSSG